MSERKKRGILSLNVKKINQLAFGLEYNSKIGVGEFIFLYTINPTANMQHMFTEIC